VAGPARFVRTWGGGRRRLLLIHGISSNAAGWYRVAGDLAGDGWAVTACDLPGHGGRPAPADWSFAGYARELAAAGSGWTAVLGHSLGGAVAVTAAGQDPAWTRGLVLADPALIMDEAARDLTAAWLLEDYRRPLTTAEVAAANPRWTRQDCRHKADALRRSGVAVVTATLEANRPWNLIAETAALQVPTVILGSDPAAGGILPVALGEWLVGANPLIRYRMLAGAGHSAHREADTYPAYLAAVRFALAEVSAVA
jgi:pimeloyl-ACP methyl ester carboxylesterase